MIQELSELEKQGFVRSSRHNTLPLTVYKYTAKCQYEKAFGDYPILRLARGLILDDDGIIRARSYSKFWNYSEMQSSELPIGSKNFVIETKLDGSCLIVFRYEGQVIYSTLGSFNSDQAILGAKVFKELYSEDWIEEGKTFLFELIGPSNRIVNYYSNDDLILHGIIDTQSGLDADTDKSFKKVQTYEVEGEIFGDELYSKLLSLNKKNEEGYVLKVKEDGIPTWMCKIKFSDYCNLHKLITNFTNISVYDCLVNHTNFDNLLESTPDEFFNFVKTTKSKLEQEYSLIENRAFIVLNIVSNLPTRKEQAIVLKNNYSNLSAIVFKMLDNAPYENLIWKMIKPAQRICPFEDQEAM